MTKGLDTSGGAKPGSAPAIGLRHRLSVRQAVQALLAALVLGLIFSTLQIVRDFARNEARVDALVEQVVEASEGPARSAVFNWDSELAERVIEGVISYPAVRRVELKSKDGKMLADISRPEDESADPPGFAANLFGPDRISATRLRNPGGREIGELVLHIDSASLTGDFLERSGETVLGTFLLILPLAALLSLMFYFQLTRPILKTARRIWGLGPRGPETGTLAAPRGHQKDELGLLIRAVEELRGRFADTDGDRDQDIAERKAAEAALRKSEQRFQDFADSASDWFYEIGPDRRLTYLSERMREVTGIDPSSTLGLRFEDLPSTDHEASDYHELLAALRAHRPYRGLIYHRRLEDGSIRSLESSGKPIFDDDGEFCGFRGTTTDVTERVRSQAALAAAQETLLRNARLAALGELTASVAHELRNPLGAVASSAHVIRRKCGTEDADVTRALELADRGIRRCDNIITELLDFTRAKGLQLVPSKIDSWLSDLLDEQDLPDAVTLERDLRADGAIASFDPEALRRAIINVVDNAREAIMGDQVDDEKDQGGRLRVSTTAGADRLEIQVGDDGPGIPCENLEKIMEPLFSTKAFGTGLGLPTVQRIMEEHGGGVEISSEEGRGTNVTLWLRLNDHADRPAKA